MKMISKTKLQKPSEKKKLLFGRVEMIKPFLPKDWRKRLAQKHPEYDSLEMADFLRNVHSLRTSDESLTIILETIAEDYQQFLRDEEFSLNKLLKRQKLTRV